MGWWRFLLIAGCCKALVFETGQHISKARLEKQRHPSLTPHNHSFYDLRQVEDWMEARQLTQHHLKVLYQALQQRPVDKQGLRQLLVQRYFPQKHLSELLSTFRLSTTRVRHTQTGAQSTKLAIQLDNNDENKVVETVLIKHQTSKGRRYTVCVSSQVGCGRACPFCATGTMQLRAQLQPHEIVEQVLHARALVQEQQQQVQNIVFMGMGEPLDNFENVLEACRILTHQCIVNVSPRKVTISTVGVAPDKIRALARRAPNVHLAISLHGASAALREQLVPASKLSPPLPELEAALDDHAATTGREFMIEYLLIDGVNDTPAALQDLIAFCHRRSSPPYVNLIPYNPTLAGSAMDFTSPSDDSVNEFHQGLLQEGIRCYVRWSSAAGRDANAACGQLVVEHK